MNRLQHVSFIIVGALFALTFAGGAASAQAPELIPYQGYLTDGNGDPVDGNVRMTFRMYTNSDDPSPAWEEDWANVPVQAGVFVVYLGQFNPIVEGVADGDTMYLGIEVNGDGEAAPRQRVGSVPYALNARDSYYFRGYGPDYFVSQDELNVALQNVEPGEVDLDGYVTEDELAAALAGLGDTYVTVEQLENYLTAEDIENFLTVEDFEANLANYVTRDELNVLLENYVTADELAAAIADFITEADLATYLENNNYLTENDLAAYLENNNFVQDADLDALIARIDALEAQVAGLADAGQAYILGRSQQTSNGRFTFNNANGIQAAHAMCQATFANEPTAHLCTPDEIVRAVSAGRWNAAAAPAFDGVRTWTMAQAFGGNPQALRNTCQSFMYGSADVSVGSTAEVDLDYTSDGNNGGLTAPAVKITQGINCGQAHPVLCCR